MDATRDLSHRLVFSVNMLHMGGARIQMRKLDCMVSVRAE
jgi:hypothetical protein